MTTLGVFDVGSNGLTDSHPVGIWDSGGNLIVSATVSNADPLTDSTSSFGDWRFTAMNPSILLPGSYTIGAFYPTNQDGFAGSQIGATALLTTASWLTYGEALATNGTITTFGQPVSPQSADVAPAFFGPNFESFALAEVPEPGTFWILAGGVGGAFVLRRRKSAGH